MSTFKKWLLIIIIVIALLHTIGGGFADMFGGMFFTASHGWNEGLIYMLLALVVAIAVK
jgi:hypothetical protein